MRRSMVGEKSLELQFTAFGRDFKLLLKPETHFFHKNFTLAIDGQKSSSQLAKIHLYSGIDQNDPSVRVHGNLAHEVFDGTIIADEEMYHIEPSRRYLRDASHHSVIYRHSDLDLSTVSRATCGSSHEALRRELLQLQDSVIRSAESARLQKRQTTGFDSTLVRCWLYAIADYKFVTALEAAGDNPLSVMSTIILTGSRIFERTDFDDDGLADGIHFGILGMEVENTPPASGTFYDNQFISVLEFLNEHSTADWSQYCLSYRFTSRDFDNGVVGLAYVAPQSGVNAAGGICENIQTFPGDANQTFSGGVNRTLNTGIVSILNYNTRIPSAIAAFTFAHEAGHNFGSTHDPPVDPPEAGGVYLMDAFPLDGSQPNNDQFSPRSRAEMLGAIRDRGQSLSDGCLLADSLCGNNLLDEAEGEQCDCGPLVNSDGICTDNPCCNGTSCLLTTSMNFDCISPSFQVSEYYVEISESVLFGHLLIIVMATDVDTENLTYDITSGNEQNKFSLEPDTGQLLVTSYLDFEDTQTYTLTVRATDNVTPPAFASITVNVLNENDNAPMFSMAAYSTTIPENTPLNITVLCVGAIDRDNDSLIAYALAETDVFRVDSSGAIFTQERLDFENASSHSFMVIATDNGNLQLSTIAPVTIFVAARNDTTIDLGTVGSSCPGVMVCEAEQDSVWWLFFPVTVAGFSYSRQCPQNGTGTTSGTATRFCTLKGMWEAMNIDNCAREEISLLNNTANEIFLRNASQNEVDNLLVSLAEATNVNATGDSTIFPQDLSTTNLIVKSSVNYLIQNIESAGPMSSLNFSEGVLNILSNVLDERNTEGWKDCKRYNNGKELYGQYVSLALRSEAVDTGDMTEITLVRQNIVLSAMKVDPTNLEDITFPEVIKVSEETGSAQTVIPAALFAERGAREGNVSAVNILFSNLEGFLPKTNLEMNTTRPVSQVISSQVFSDVKLNNFQTKATFNFTTQKFSESEVAENATCVFWSVSSDAANSRWSMEGVTTVSVDEDKQMRVYNIVCESSHFTAFAVLMDVTGALNDTTPEIRFALSLLTYVGCSISIFFLLLTIIYFLALRKELLTRVHNFIHLNLSISLLLGYVAFLSGIQTAVANKIACAFVAALLHYLFTAVFFWMLCEGIMLYLMLVVVFSQISKKWWIFFIIGWGVPVIPVAISAGLIHDQYGTEEYCWIAVGAGDKGAVWAFVAPMLLVVLVNIFFLLAALCSVYKQKKLTMQQRGKKESLQLFSQLFKATIILLPLLGLTWVFGLLSVNSNTIVFAWLFTIFNSLQGLFVFFFHVLRSEKVTNFLKRCRSKTDSGASTSTSGKNNLSKNPTTIVHLKPRDSKFSKHDRSTMQNESIKVDETALETGSPKSWIA
ncbi:adhesion G protein-coupled receptor L3-like isoform X2 [Halichondria panicea]